MSVPLTAKQAEVLAFMRGFFAENDQLPPARVIRERFGWASDNAAADFVAALMRKGHLERNAIGRYRFTRSTECASAPAASTTR